MAQSPPKSEDKQARLARALRANLKRRKARDRALAEGGAARPAEPGGEEAPASPDPGPNPAQKDT